ncbi:probable ECF sigma factor [Lentisphaera araneosa HTCC2155]|jgi:RNA polymerase sigma factor (sigma-70 family)|uniref:RNA polymerase sigma factor SigS n=1 Tax=Lentisphaera araneosa HTCC2155 TaxID=313628 RepID=A6DHX8_9BACT|nr:sigma-70 family RNA polymerase sigma factor [Lentisphaera araneosa]EDM28632.1 probable ECF sigma factor [Lentisphaera araneosa HTCC2155]
MNEEFNTWSTRHTLLHRLKDQHDEKSWEEFMLTYQKYIYNICKRSKLQHNEAEEFTQEILVKLWKKLPDLDIRTVKGSFRAWLKTMIKNHITNYFNRQKMIREKLTVNNKESLLPYIDKISKSDIDEIIDNEWHLHITNLALDKVKESLSSSTVNAFLMSLEGRSTEEIAKELSITESTVYVHKKAVKDALQKHIRQLKITL